MLRFFYVCLTAGLFAALILAGCAPNASLVPKNDRTPLAENAVAEAVDAYNRGDTRRGDAVLNRAVMLLTDAAPDDFSDGGYIAVAKRLNEKGRPQDALRLLTPLTKDRRVSGDPLLWAIIARSAQLSSDAAREAEAVERAKTEANRIVAAFGEAGGKQKATLAEQATRAGQYFDEYAPDYSKALPSYREAYRLAPGPATASRLGYTLANRGASPADFVEAVELTKKAVEERPNEPLFLDAFGWALFKRGNAATNDLAGARRRLSEAGDLSPNNAGIHSHLATVYEAAHELRDALREARIAAQLAPGDAPAKAQRDRLAALVAAMPSPAPSPSPTEATQSPPPER